MANAGERVPLEELKGAIWNFPLEVLFLVVVASHTMLGIRAILMDFGLSDRVEKLVSRALTVVGVLTVGYGMWLTWAIVH